MRLGLVAVSYAEPYEYCANDPVNNWDPDGLFWDTIFDIGSVVIDTGRMAYHAVVTGNTKKMNAARADVAIDIVAMAIPFLPAGIAKVRYLDDIVDGTKALDKGLDGAKATDKAADSLKKKKQRHWRKTKK